MKLSTGQPILYYSNWLDYEVVGIVQSATNKTVEFLVNGSDQERPYSKSQLALRLWDTLDQCFTTNN
jgi:hypothetical protein